MTTRDLHTGPQADIPIPKRAPREGAAMGITGQFCNLASHPKCKYANDGTRITAPGKFEGEPIFTPYFWDLGLEGFADADSGSVYTFRITKSDSGNPFWPQIKAWLGRKRTIRIVEDSQGFVHCC